MEGGPPGERLAQVPFGLEPSTAEHGLTAPGPGPALGSPRLASIPLHGLSKLPGLDESAI
ncbi:hypothetical protein IG631_21822 [Alternaria alternata]|nr:hypothetical protein IG631_21822 [Alternaria alternata]